MLTKIQRQFSWRFDMLIYRLFYWRWSQRLATEPRLAYLFSEWSKGWANRNPIAAKCEVEVKEVIERYAVRSGWRA